MLNEERLTNEEAAKRIGITPKTLVNWRGESRGPRYLKPGQKVFYRPEDVDEWMLKQLHETDES